MFLRRLAQQLVEDEDSDESLRSAAWKRDNSVTNDGTILGIDPGGKLWTRANLNSDWIKVPYNLGQVSGITQLLNGTILGIDLGVTGITQLNDGTILGIDPGGKLWTRATLDSDWIKVSNTMGQVTAITQLNYPKIPVNNNNIKDGDETDVDCGGTSGKKCAVGKTCKVNTDCDNVLCTSGVCQSPSCSDGLKNGGEADVDCGGPCSTKCDNGKTCSSTTDCVSKVCSGSQCQAPMNHDNVMNGDETDVDCGGSSGNKCAVGKTCKVNTDCDNVLCTGGFCSILGMNLVVNGDAETGPCGQDDTTIMHPTGWNYTGTVSQITYVASWDLTSSSPGPSNPGRCYFDGLTDSYTSMSQTVNINDAAILSLIDLGKASANLSAWLGGYANQDDNAKVTLSFYNQDGENIGNAITIGPVLSSDRGTTTELLFRQNSGMVPARTRSMKVLVEFTRLIGGFNDGAADNIAVVLSGSG
ncbi:unnamed protein product [Adineta steineri]|uniref:Uncharacterized protein n=1 Tax=Adineta steineri TaxID=433720 RepID=A0A819SF51_9BILA|nr:unnamed protein product [Adineta steineri]